MKTYLVDKLAFLKHKDFFDGRVFHRDHSESIVEIKIAFDFKKMMPILEKISV